MQLTRFTLFFPLVLLFLSACRPDAPSTSPKKISVDAEAASYAKGFDFIYIDETTCLRLINLESDSLALHCMICDGPTPYPLHDLQYTLPSKDVRIAAVSTTHLSLFERANAIEHLVGVAFADRIFNPAGQAAIKSGKIADLSGEKDIDTERTLAAAPHLLTTYPFGGNDYTTLKRAGIIVLPFSEYLETHPLGRAEWIKVAGFLTGKLTDAKIAFANISASYEALSAITSGIPPDERPIVFTGSHANGQWFAPPANSFMGVFTHDAGGRYLFETSDQKANLTMDFEVLIERAMEADFWGKIIYTPGDLKRSDLRADDARYAELPAFQKNQVFYCNAADTDYFGDAIVEPDAVLADLIAILHPERRPRHRFRYFKPVTVE